MRQTYKYMGFLLTLNGWAVRLGIPYDVLRLRLAKGWSVKRAFETPVDKSERASAREARAKRNAPHKKRVKVLEYNGERRTVSEWARRLDVPKATIYLRLRRGHTVGQALGLEPIKFDYLWRCRKVTYKGETLTTREWADRLHLSLNWFNLRLKKGLPEEAVFAENLHVRQRKERAARKRAQLKSRKLALHKSRKQCIEDQ